MSRRFLYGASSALLQQVVCPVLVGRRPELHALLQLLAEASTGRGETVLIGGDAGVGKSRLCRELKREAASRRFRVIEGRCSSIESSVPYGPFMDALRFRVARGEGDVAAKVLGPLISHLAPLYPEFGESEEEAAEPQPAPTERPFEAIIHVLQRLAGLGPVLFVLEDVHWADPTSLELLHYFTRRIGTLPMLLVATYRSDELHVGHPTRRLFAALGRERLGREIVLASLTEGEVGEMVHAIVGAPPPADFVSAVWQRTEGNAFFVEELLKKLADAGRLDPARLSAEDLTAAGLPVTISETVIARVEPLGPRAREVLSIAAVIGRRFTFDLLREVSGIEEEELLPILEQLLAHQLLVEERGGDEDYYAFRHVLTQEVLYDDIIARRRRLWHRQVAEALERRQGGRHRVPYDELAYHFRLGGDGVSARKYAVLAGDQAARLYAWGDAEVRYERALSALEGVAPDPAVEAEVLEKLAMVTWWQDRPGDARQYAEEALSLRRSLGDPRRTGPLLRQLGLLYAYQQNEWRRAVDCLREALDLLGRTDDRAETGRVANDLGRLFLARGDFKESERWLRQGLEIARETEDRAEEAFALAKLGHLAVLRGTVADGIGCLEDARAIMKRIELPLDRATGIYNAGIRAFEAAREHERAREWIDEASAYAREHGVSANVAVYQSFRASLDRRAGRWNEAIEAAQRAVDDLRRVQRSEAGEALRVLGDLHRVRGDFDLAQAAYDQALQFGERDAEVGRALLLLARGQAHEAASSLRRSLAERDPEDRLFSIRVLPHLVKALLATGGVQESEDALYRLQLETSRSDYRAGPAALAQTAGVVRAAKGEVRQAIEALEEAVEAWGRVGQPFEVARARLDLAATLLDTSSEVSRGASLARAALSEFEALGSLAGMDRARQVLRRAGLRAPARRGAPETDRASHGLTARELRVLEELAKGGTNKEIARALGISEKTVSIHVSHILAKLGCSTRTQAVVTAGLIRKG